MTFTTGKKYKPLKSKPLVSDYPHCAGRGLILTHFDGKRGSQHRIDFSKWQDFIKDQLTQEQRYLWNIQMLADGGVRPAAQRDAMGFLPDSFELFLASLPKSLTPAGPPPAMNSDTAAGNLSPAEDAAMAATATKKKVAKKRPAKKAVKKKAAKRPSRAKAAAKPSANGAAKLKKNGNAKFDADQQPLPGMEDVKVPAIETCIKSIASATAQRESLKDDIETEHAKLPGLLKKHDLEHYSAHGYDAVRVPGCDTVKLRKVKQK